jgi:hypothetical protein
LGPIFKILWRSRRSYRKRIKLGQHHGYARRRLTETKKTKWRMVLALLGTSSECVPKWRWRSGSQLRKA